MDSLKQQIETTRRHFLTTNASGIGALLDKKPVRFGGDDEQFRIDRLRPFACKLEKRFLTDERYELFREAFARQWPKPGSRAAAKNDRVNDQR